MNSHQVRGYKIGGYGNEDGCSSVVEQLSSMVQGWRQRQTEDSTYREKRLFYFLTFLQEVPFLPISQSQWNTCQKIFTA